MNEINSRFDIGKFVNKSIYFALILCLCIALPGCGKKAEEQEPLSSDIEISVETLKEDVEEGASDEDVNETADEDGEKATEELMNGEMFYNIGADLSESVKNANDTLHKSSTCFMQPMLQNPTENGVTVQWFTEEAGGINKLLLYASEDDWENETPAKEYQAKTVKMTRIRGGKTDGDKDNPSVSHTIFKHVAVVDELPEYHGYLSERRYYKIVTDNMTSGMYSLAARAAKGTPMRILLTSDHQIKNMVAANIQKVYETVGNVDAVLVNGDLVDVSDRAYDWFYADNSFFRCMTGTASDEINGSNYTGAPLLQQAPMYTSIGNHDVMGVYDNVTPLSTQFNEPRPKWLAEEKWETYNITDKTSREQFIEDNSYNTITTEEIFENPSSNTGGEKYYSISIGDIRLITLDVSRVWRLPNIGLGGKYSEVPGYSRGDFSGGEFIFESVKEGSAQIKFLDEELAKDEYKNARIKMVMFHSEAHSMGGNQIPAFTDPVAREITVPTTGQSMTIYDYPINKDYINSVIEPRLIKSGTNILFEAHSHLWNRFVTESGMNIIESSNVGNSYGGYDDVTKRDQYPSAFNASDLYHMLSEEWDRSNYISGGDPYGLEPVSPNITSLPDNKPYLSSNTITVFTILDTYKGTVDSYYFDTEHPDSDVVLFDSFSI